MLPSAMPISIPPTIEKIPEIASLPPSTRTDMLADANAPFHPPPRRRRLHVHGDPPTHDCFVSFLSFGSPSDHRYTHRAPQPAASPRLPSRCPRLSYYKSCSPTTALATTTLLPPLPKSLPQPTTRPSPTRPRPRTPKMPGAPHRVKQQLHIITGPPIPSPAVSAASSTRSTAQSSGREGAGG